MTPMIMVIDDDRGWTSYYKSLLSDFEVEFFQDGVAATARMDEKIPKLVILDILLTGPTGFSILHEMQSYTDLSKVPVLIVSSIDLDLADIAKYGAIKIFNKSTMLPNDLLVSVQELMQ